MGVCWSKAQGKVWTELRDVEVISIPPVVEVVMEDEVTQLVWTWCSHDLQ